LSLPTIIQQEFVKAEIVLSEQMGATYYPTSKDSVFIGSRLAQFGKSTAPLLEKFTNARSSQLAAVQKLIKPSEVAFSPPLIIAYALTCAQTLKGFGNVIRDLRHDSAILRLRKLFAKLDKSEPHEQILICTTIDSELRRILELDNSFVQAAEIIQCIPTLSVSTWAEAANNISKLAKIDDLIQRLQTRSRLNILRKLHKTVPSVGEFYTDLRRIFGSLAFNEKQLRYWLARPFHTFIDRVGPEREARRKTIQDNAERLLRLLNERIAVKNKDKEQEALIRS
jgi:hypothetical protein